ncbi:MAG TPA: anthranilate phosphoribosyltransferase [Candidatus Acidoferrales bacterium]|jgi:anthranilate phosphoribosyltransferase|nr:anthranilate phosphoribosyltransferase [Candidatus Acidoferrales bacterium]
MNSASHLLIEKTEAGRTLSRAEAEAFMEELLSGRIATPEIVRMLLALNRRAVSVDELSGFARVMRKHAAPVFAPDEPRLTGLVDTCGTGGDETGTFNISTASAIVAATAGARVAKHGNRSVSSRSGSADVLEALGVRIDLPLAVAGRSVREIGLGFLFAPVAHAAARHAAPARQQIAKRTIFNLLGPLTNPAGAEAQVLGVFSADVIDSVAATLAELGTSRAFVVHGAGGLDEISLSGETQIAEVRDGRVRRFIVAPEDFGVSRAPLEAIRGGTPIENAKLIHSLLAGEPGPRLDIVIANAAAALVVTGAAEDFRSAAELARRAVASGEAREKLERLKDFSQRRTTPK